jgi:hypothetical protein
MRLQLLKYTAAIVLLTLALITIAAGQERKSNLPDGPGKEQL